MAKAVLLSIRPEWVKKILAGEKTLEARKSKPKLEEPFKVYIYCTNPKNTKLWKSRRCIYVDDFSRNDFDRCWNGSVVGEFICNNITEDAIGENCDILCVNGCMGLDQIKSYGGNKKLYGWHISELKVYDTPKPLSQFKGLRKTKFGYEPVEIKRQPQSWYYVEELK